MTAEPRQTLWTTRQPWKTPPPHACGPAGSRCRRAAALTRARPIGVRRRLTPAAHDRGFTEPWPRMPAALTGPQPHTTAIPVRAPGTVVADRSTVRRRRAGRGRPPRLRLRPPRCRSVFPSSARTSTARATTAAVPPSRPTGTCTRCATPLLRTGATIRGETAHGVQRPPGPASQPRALQRDQTGNPPRATVPGRRSKPLPSAMTTASSRQSKRRPWGSWLAQSAHIAPALVQAGSSSMSRSALTTGARATRQKPWCCCCASCLPSGAITPGSDLRPQRGIAGTYSSARLHRGGALAGTRFLRRPVPRPRHNCILANEFDQRHTMGKS